MPDTAPEFMTRRVAQSLLRSASLARPFAVRAVFIFIVAGYVLAMAVLCLFAQSARGLPSVESFWSRNRPVSVQFFDRFGRDLAIRGAKETLPVKLDALPPSLADALVAIEDRRYYTHAGFDVYALTRAAVTNAKAGRIVEGGSTISQQLAKNVFLTHERTAHRKVQELLLTLWIERSFSKEEILEKYLDRVYFGGQAWGVEAASQQFFQKPAKDLTLGESALLAGLLKAPSAYNPIIHPERAGERAATVLKVMENTKAINHQARKAALTQKIIIKKPTGQNSVNYFIDWIWPQIETQIGTPQSDIVVRTTLDRDMQYWAEQAAVQNLDPERNAAQTAIISLAGDGGVRAMIGGASYSDSEFNRAVQARRQPGSAFKTFVYLAAFNAGLNPWDVRRDEKITVDGWTPRNFSGYYHGDMTLEQAFARSVNTVSVAISEEIGRDRVIETAHTLGLDKPRALPSLALGAMNMSPIELTKAYLPFANWGDRAEPYGIISISSAQGQPLFQHKSEPYVKVVSSQSLGHMNRIMVEAVEHGTGRRAHIDGQDVAGKTGTTNDYRDAWFIGYVQDMVTGVWVGADDNSPMQAVTGGSIPAQIWHDMMAPILAPVPRKPLPVSQPPLRADNDRQLEILLDDLETILPN